MTLFVLKSSRLAVALDGTIAAVRDSGVDCSMVVSIGEEERRLFRVETTLRSSSPRFNGQGLLSFSCDMYERTAVLFSASVKQPYVSRLSSSCGIPACRKLNARMM